MDWRARQAWPALFLGSMALVMSPDGALGQTGASTAGGSLSMLANPYTNPLMNPYTNPYANPLVNPNASQTQMGAGNALLYYMAAQKMNGGIGSGRMGGPGVEKPGGVEKPLAKGQANVPGATASRYFSRGKPAYTGTKTYFGRQKGHFPENTKSVH